MKKNGAGPQGAQGQRDMLTNNDIVQVTSAVITVCGPVLGKAPSTQPTAQSHYHKDIARMLCIYSFSFQWWVLTAFSVLLLLSFGVISTVMKDGEIFNIFWGSGKLAVWKRSSPETSSCSHKGLILKIWGSSSFGLLCSLTWKQTNKQAVSLAWCAEASSQEPTVRISCLHHFQWCLVGGLELVMMGVFASKKLAKATKSRLFSFLREPVVKCLLAHHCF